MADQQVGKIMTALRPATSSTTPSWCSRPTTGRSPVGTSTATDADGQGYYNWYYGTRERRVPGPAAGALQPLVDTDNLAMSYSDSMVRAWLIDQSPARVQQAVRVMAQMPDVSAVWKRQGTHFVRVTPVRWDRMPSKGERDWFKAHAQELLDTTAAKHGPT